MNKKMLKQKKTGQIIVISAPSGAGKGTVIGKLLERDNKSRWLSVSATSRKPREGEKEGVNYYYLTEDDFKEKIDDLVDDLEAVKSETDEVEQCKMLSKIFGDDFPIPEKKNAAKKQMNFIPSTSASGVN